MAVKGLVIGGSKAARGQFPWYCLMIMDGSSLCGGSIISAKAILTAAHCVDGLDFNLLNKREIILKLISFIAKEIHQIKSN